MKLKSLAQKQERQVGTILSPRGEDSTQMAGEVLGLVFDLKRMSSCLKDLATRKHLDPQ